MDQEDIFEIILERYHDSVGDVAYTQAGRMEGVDIGSEGDIDGEPDPEDIEELIDIFRDVMGDGSYGIAREAVRNAYEEDKSVSDLDLPEKIVPKEVKAEQFASAL